VGVEWCGYMVSRDKGDRVELVLQRMRHRGGGIDGMTLRAVVISGIGFQIGANRQRGVLVNWVAVYGGLPVAQSTITPFCYRWRSTTEGQLTGSGSVWQ
jgi:hypothetical protein